MSKPHTVHSAEEIAHTVNCTRNENVGMSFIERRWIYEYYGKIRTHLSYVADWLSDKPTVKKEDIYHHFDEFLEEVFGERFISYPEVSVEVNQQWRRRTPLLGTEMRDQKSNVTNVLLQVLLPPLCSTSKFGMSSVDLHAVFCGTRVVEDEMLYIRPLSQKHEVNRTFKVDDCGFRR